MTVTITNQPKTEPTPQQRQKTAFAKWYANPENRKALAEKRKKKYAEDPAHREKLRSKARAATAAKKSDHAPEGYDFDQTQACTRLKVYGADLKRWRDRGWMPEPVKSGRKLLFTEKQLDLLEELAEFFHHGGKGEDPARTTISATIFANWA